MLNECVVGTNYCSLIILELGIIGIYCTLKTKICDSQFVQNRAALASITDFR